MIYGKTIRLPVHSEFEIPLHSNELIRHRIGENVNKSNEQINNESNIRYDRSPQQSNGKIDLKDLTSNEKNDATNNSTPISKIDEEDKISLDGGFNSRTVRCRLINYVRNQNEAELCENSDSFLLFHIHGGGFVLSSPDSHELYLRDWAVKLKGKGFFLIF